VHGNPFDPLFSEARYTELVINQSLAAVLEREYRWHLDYDILLPSTSPETKLQCARLSPTFCHGAVIIDDRYRRC
jgi:hypothetical protein